jgi:hypothetical protein
MDGCGGYEEVEEEEDRFGGEGEGIAQLTDVGGVAAARNYSSSISKVCMSYVYTATHLYSPPASTSTNSPSRKRWSFRV